MATHRYASNDPKLPPAAKPRGRGSVSNPDVRFDAWRRESYDDGWSGLGEEPAAQPTLLIPDSARSVIARNDSPDVPFSQSINPYRGCEHGCAYCYARPSHAYLGFSPGLDFETRIVYKPEAAARLRAELSRRGYRCEPIALGTNTDVYQPAERKLKITRAIVEVLHACRHPLTIVTKSALVLRDFDLLSEMARANLAQVTISITTLEAGLARRLEPRAASPARRLEVLRAAREAGIPAGVLVAPLIPALNDHEMERILHAARQAGAGWAGYVLLRMPLELKDLMQAWLDTHDPGKAKHVMSLMRQTHGGRESLTGFGERMRGIGELADLYERRFRLACGRLGFGSEAPPLDCTTFRSPRPGHGQLDLF